MLIRIGVAIILTGAIPPAAVAQEGAGPDRAGSAAVQAGDAGVEFQRVFADWTETLKQLQALQLKFQSASDEDRPVLTEQFRRLMASARDLAPRLIASAEKAYIASPNKNKELADLLLRVAYDNLRADNYEEALRLAKILADNKAPDQRTCLLGGVAAFHVSQFDLAESYLQVAAQAGLLDESQAQANRVNPALLNQATQCLADLADFRRLWEAERKIRDAEAAADDLPRVQLETTKGNLVLELFENEAPNTVANVVSLVEKGFYNGLPFHRVLPQFMAQGGCPRGDGTGGPGYRIPCECHAKNARLHFRGSLSVAHAGPDTGGSQFFLTFVRTPHLDGKHTVFGRVVAGIDVLGRLTRIDPSQPGPGPQPDTIVRATVLRKRGHDYQPKTLPDAPKLDPA